MQLKQDAITWPRWTGGYGTSPLPRAKEKSES
jgi:hypothetical protein